jgi:predicted RND superfamily exporter protein
LPAVTQLYDQWILKHPVYIVLFVLLITITFTLHIQDFKLDASADSLVLENDQALKYYRSIKARYGSDDFLIITYTPKQDLFSTTVLDDIARLRDKIKGLDHIASVISILDVPLIQSPPVTLFELSDKIRTLETPDMAIPMARKELLNSPLYVNRLVSPDGDTTAIQVNFKRDETYHDLLKQRNHLREIQLTQQLNNAQQRQLNDISSRFRDYVHNLQDQETQLIEDVRSIMDQHRSNAKLHLGGVPMIAADSLDYIQNDLKTFGIGVIIFIIMILAAAFRKPRWVILPMITCFMSGIIMIGLLGLLDWRVTVVSSNFISLMLIINLSLTIHLIVRYRELHAKDFSTDQHALVLEMVRSKFLPSFYTAITTMVAFASLIVSGIRPVIDFGWMMVIGVFIAFIFTFLFFPAALMFFKPGKADKLNDITGYITRNLAILINRYSKTVITLFVLLSIVSIFGISALTVENRFIDYYKQDTEIYQGMELIDRKLGGTTPMDIVIDAPASFFLPASVPEHEEPADNEFDMEFDDEESGGITATSYWFKFSMMEKIRAIHNYLESLPETGKVLSIHTSLSMLEKLKDTEDIDNFFLSIIYKRLPDNIKQALFTPYMLDDGNQIRFSVRIFESDMNLQRNALIEKTSNGLINKFGLKQDEVHLTGMAILYNNLLQSLFRSQILTIGVVFFAILLMFAILFKSLYLAVIAIIPNMVAASMMLGLMGISGIPLDIMTITIAAVCIGIAVDDTIHYIHRYKKEFQTDHHYQETIIRCHSSIGRAMYFTSVTITIGFSILALSNFIPIIYFGLLTGFAITIALIANMTLLPVLISALKPKITY